MTQAWENLSDPIFHYAQTRGDAIALVDGNETLTYRALAALIAGAGVYLRDLGIAQGDRVGIALTNSADHVILLFALLRAGATPVEFSVDDLPETLATIADKYGIRTVFTEAHTGQPPVVARIRVDLGWRRKLEANTGDQRSTASADALEIVSLTTGSTGLPQGVIWTHRQYMQHIALRLAILYPQPKADFRPADFLLTGALRFGWFFIGMLMQLSAGGRLVLLPEMSKASDLIRTIAASGPALVCVTANVCRAFLAVAPEQGLLFPQLYLLESSGLPLIGEEKRAIASRVAANFIESYGTAGIGTISTLRAAEMQRQAGSVGRALPTLHVEIVGGNGIVLPRGMIGQLRCRGALMPRVCSEDAGHRGDTTIREGWYYPGDVGSLDGDGYIHLRGRVGDAIRRGGQEIHPSEIEAALISHPLVADAAVVGAPISPTEYEVVAFVVPRGALSHDEIERHCRTRLAPDRLPDRIYYPNDLPRIAGGKVDRRRLLAIAAEERAKRTP